MYWYHDPFLPFEFHVPLGDSHGCLYCIVENRLALTSHIVTHTALTLTYYLASLACVGLSLVVSILAMQMGISLECEGEVQFGYTHVSFISMHMQSIHWRALAKASRSQGESS